jgi:DNA polymerase
VPTQARSRERLRRVLDAADELLATEGADTFTTNRIAAVAGIPVGSVYRYFPDKEAIVEALATRYWSEFADLVAAAAEADEPLSLAEIRERIGDCRRCKLCEGRTNIVFGVGDPQARLMFVGEGPGRDEDLKGEPFVGRAGQLLTKIIEAMGLAREQVYIANTVKCRPPDNRLPEPDEVATCQPFLRQQIAAIRPKVIVALGSLAAQTLLGTNRGITALRGRFHDAGAYKVMPTFHPAYLLRNPAAKREVWEDMKLVRDALAASAAEGPAEGAE